MLHNRTAGRKQPRRWAAPTQRVASGAGDAVLGARFETRQVGRPLEPIDTQWTADPHAVGKPIVAQPTERVDSGAVGPRAHRDLFIVAVRLFEMSLYDRTTLTTRRI